MSTVPTRSCGDVEAHIHAACLLCIKHEHHGQDDPCQFVILTCAEFAEVVLG